MESPDAYSFIAHIDCSAVYKAHHIYKNATQEKKKKSIQFGKSSEQRNSAIMQHSFIATVQDQERSSEKLFIHTELYLKFLLYIRKKEYTKRSPFTMIIPKFFASSQLYEILGNT